MRQLPVERACHLADRAEERRWLIDGLWLEEAVGIIGGEPKCCKSFLVLDMAVAIASGKPCLRRYPVLRPGRVLLYAAEDALHIVRRRLEGICAAAGTCLTDLDIQVITATTLRLDLDADRAALDDAVARLKPRLLILDPFVRLHRIDENLSGEVAPLLAFLRDLQRRHGTAVRPHPDGQPGFFHTHGSTCSGHRRCGAVVIPLASRLPARPTTRWGWNAGVSYLLGASCFGRPTVAVL